MTAIAFALGASLPGAQEPPGNDPAKPVPPAGGEPPRILEGSPEGGLPYRLTMAAGATDAKPSRLVIWLHPAGGPYNEKVEEMAPLFLKHGLALLVITRKSFDEWSYDDAVHLFGVTLPEVSGISGIDSKKPILMGFSAGGQLAIRLWHIKPANYGGIILDAAYPLAEQDGVQTPLDLPTADGVTTVPLFVLVGAKDEVSAVWRKAEGKWRKAGVQLTIRYVKGKGHQWLFGEEETAALDGWLSALPQAIVPPQEEPAPAAQP